MGTTSWVKWGDFGRVMLLVAGTMLFGASAFAQAVEPVKKDPLQDAADKAKDQAKDTRETLRDTKEQARDQARDAGKDVRDTRRETREEIRDARREFRVERVRPADFGLWFSRNVDRGLAIADIASRGVISKLGLREGDVVVSVNGHRITREGDFVTRLFSEDTRNDRIKVIVSRNGREEVIYVEPGTLIDELIYVEEEPLETFGVVIDDRYSDRIVVWRVLPRSPAYYAGIRAGDVISTFRGQRVATVADLTRLVRNLEPGYLTVNVNRANRARDIEVEIPRDYGARSHSTFRQNLDADKKDQPREERREERTDRKDPPRDEGKTGTNPAEKPVQKPAEKPPVIAPPVVTPPVPPTVPGQPVPDPKRPGEPLRPRG